MTSANMSWSRTRPFPASAIRRERPGPEAAGPGIEPGHHRREDEKSRPREPNRGPMAGSNQKDFTRRREEGRREGAKKKDRVDALTRSPPRPLRVLRAFACQKNRIRHPPRVSRRRDRSATPRSALGGRSRPLSGAARHPQSGATARSARPRHRPAGHCRAERAEAPCPDWPGARPRPRRRPLRGSASAPGRWRG